MGLFEAFLDADWGMEPHKLSQAAELILRHSQGARVPLEEIQAAIKVPFAAFPNDIMGEPGFFRRGSVAVIPVGGVISKFSSGVMRTSTGPGTSVTGLRNALRAAENDENIGAIMLLIDSPGGNVKGIDDVASEIRRVRASGMPVVAFAEDMMASAALWIGTQADELYANRAAEIGSIGVYTVLVDSSKKAAEEGVKVHVVTADDDDMKAIGVPGAPITDPQRAEVKRRVNGVMAMFVDAIASSPRKIAEADIRKVGGRMLSAAEAVEAGLIDGISTAEEVLDRLNAQVGGRSRRSTTTGATAMADRDTKDGKDGGSVTTASTVQTAPPDTASAAASVAANGLSPDAVKQLVAEGVSAGLKSLNERQQEIAALARDYGHLEGVQDIVNKALASADMGVDDVRKSVLAVAAEALKPVGVVSVGSAGSERRQLGMEIALLNRHFPSLADKMASSPDDPKMRKLARDLGVGTPEAFVKAHDEAVAAHFNEMNLMETARRCVHGGRGASLSEQELLEVSFREGGMRAAGAHTTSDFPNILSNLANKTMLTAFAEENTTYERWCRIGSARDFKETTLLTLSAAQNLLEIPEGENAKQSTLAERAETNMLRTFGRRFRMTRQMMINDDLGAFAAIPSLMGRAAARVPDILAYERLNAAHGVTMSDGKPFFQAVGANQRGNLLSAAALSADSLQAAINVLMLAQDFGDDAAEIMPEPRFLLVPVELQFTARKLFTDTVLPGGTNAESNPVQGRAEPIVSSRLSRASNDDWYLLADPSLYPVVEVIFLNGRRVPQIVRVGDGSPLNVEWETIFDCGAGLVQPEGGVKTPGS